MKDLKQSIQDYRSLGFEVVDRETLKVVKMKDMAGNMIELVKGKWRPHIAVNWYEDSSGNLVEVVYDEKIFQREGNRLLRPPQREIRIE